VGIDSWPQPGASLPRLSPAPDDHFGWSFYYYNTVWTAKVAVLLQAYASHWEEVEIRVQEPVCSMEAVSLKLLYGWNGS